MSFNSSGFGRDEDDRDPFERDFFELSDTVGVGGKNNPQDVIKTEVILGNLGDLDLDRTDGPTSLWGQPQEDADAIVGRGVDLRAAIDVSLAGKEQVADFIGMIDAAEKSGTPLGCALVDFFSRISGAIYRNRTPEEPRNKVPWPGGIR